MAVRRLVSMRLGSTGFAGRPQFHSRNPLSDRLHDELIERNGLALREFRGLYTRGSGKPQLECFRRLLGLRHGNIPPVLALNDEAIIGAACS